MTCASTEMILLTNRMCRQVSCNSVITLQVQIWMMTLLFCYLPNPLKAFKACFKIFDFPLLPQAAVTLGICDNLPARCLISVRVDFRIRQCFDFTSFARHTLLASKPHMLFHALRDPARPAALFASYKQRIVAHRGTCLHDDVRGISIAQRFIAEA